MATMMHVYPTYGDAIKRPAGQYLGDRFKNNFFIKTLQRMFAKKGSK